MYYSSVQTDELAPLRSPFSLPSAASPTGSFPEIPGTVRYMITPSPVQVVQEQRGPYRAMGKEEPIGARPLFVQHCYLDALMGGLLADVVDLARCEHVL